MTPEICQQLAKAVRDAILCINADENPETFKAAYDALAAYDNLPKNMAGEYRVFWEIDALDAETPREAAQEAWRAMRRVDSQANVFTVMPPDGMLHTIDLGEDPP